ncbi:Kelch motif [Luteitalea pratensis]|uniref:Kelch motif n=1 Tax=Luteitalea pratensis TaxID=1855912 RepID=A0A143PW85_LUTPR|nr:PxKF domain-containing protein [Luteitalea pratensis]AMY13017.1 Kelch motif [Luteitalea pratensis]
MRLHSSVATLVAVATTAGALMVGVKGETPIDPSGKWSPSGAMTAGREFASSALLPDGSVLVFGGRESGASMAVAERFAGGTWSPAGASPVQRWGQTATTLADGTVIIAGGTGVTSVDEQGQPVTAPTAAIERFDPSTGEVTPLAFLSGPRTGHAAARLADGRVLFAGGYDGNAVVADVEILDPETGLVSPGPADLEVARAGLSATTLMNGRVLLAGGNDGVHDLALVDIYDTEDGILISSEMSAPRRDHQAVLLAHNNQVLLIGGASNGQVAGAELYRPWTGTFLPTGSPAVARVGATAVALATEWPYRGREGQALVTGGAGAEGRGEASAESYTFATIRTDRDDYLPGDTVYVSGTGWQPNETITLGLQELPLEHETRSFTIQADELGRINNATLFLVEPHHLGVKFYLTARGAASQAQVTFTDGAVRVKTTGTAGNKATIEWQLYSAADCSGLVVSSGSILADTGNNGTNIPQATASPQSLRLTAMPLSSVGTQYTFANWKVGQAEDASNPICLNHDNSTRNVDANYAAVAQVATTTAIISSANPSTYGTLVTFTATVNAVPANPSGVGTVTFTNGSTVLCAAVPLLGNTATCSASTLPAATSAYTIAAAYSGTSQGTTPQFAQSQATLQQLVSRASATINVQGGSFTYDGDAHSATGSATGVKGETLTGLVLGDSFTNVPGGAANWVFTDVTGNYNNANGTVQIVISKANATVAVTGYTGVYDGDAHGATGSATGVKGETLTGLVLGDSFTNVAGGTANWAFTDVTGNYNNASGTATIVISKADATIQVDGYSGAYDGAAHGVTGSATGVKGETLTGLVLGDSFTNVPGGTANWAFTDITGNYNNASGTAAIVISKADATIQVDGYSGTYDGAAHGATGSATGVKGETLTGLVLGDSFTNVPGGTANWAFTDITGNYNNASGTAAIVISKADATIQVDGYSGTYDGAAHGATGSATGVKGETLTGLVLGDSYTNVPGGTANWAFTDITGNYNNASGTAAIVISKATPTVNVQSVSATFDGQAHGTTGTVAGVGGADLGAATISYDTTNGQAPVNAGSYVATGNFAGNDNYAAASNTAAIEIAKATPVITWATPADITYGTLLSAAQLNAAANVAGSLVYTPPVGTQLNAGPGQTLSVSFTPTDAANYNGASKTVQITVLKATPVVTWTNPADIIYGTALSATQLNATANVAGSFSYEPAAGVTLNVGLNQKLTVAFTPTDTANYNGASITVEIDVVYGWDGFLQPINDTAHDLVLMSKFKTGQTIPAKFVLKNAAGAVVQQTGIPTFTRTGRLGACDSAAALETPEPVSASVVPLYQWDGSQYHYNWSTKGLTAGLYRIFANLADGTAQSVDICLTK